MCAGFGGDAGLEGTGNADEKLLRGDDNHSFSEYLLSLAEFFGGDSAACGNELAAHKHRKTSVQNQLSANFSATLLLLAETSW